MCDNSIKLLEKVIAKIDELKSIDSDSYENFNILSILGKEADEVIMCKILWAILDHKIGGQRLLLKGFVKDILNMSLEESEYDSSSVYREYCIPDNSRRIDLVIKTKKHFIPIEAKIYAEDQAKQCADYIRFAGRYYNSQDDVMLYYLTIDKHKPSLSSIDGDAKLMNQIKLIVWEQILEWLNSEKGNIAAMADIIGQYCKALEMLLDRKRCALDMGIDQMLDSPDSMRAAIEIENALNRKKTDLMMTIYNEIIDKVSEDSRFNFDKRLNDPWDYTVGIKEYYSRKISSSTYPALTYNLGLIDKDPDGREYYLIIRYEIEWRSYVGFSIMDIKGETLSLIDKPSDDLLKKAQGLLKNPDILKSNKSCWLYWEYITSNNQDATDDEPEFRSMNDAYLALYDSAKRTEYVDRVVDMLKKFMDNMK